MVNIWRRFALLLVLTAGALAALGQDMVVLHVRGQVESKGGQALSAGMRLSLDDVLAMRSKDAMVCVWVNGKGRYVGRPLDPLRANAKSTPVPLRKILSTAAAPLSLKPEGPMASKDDFAAYFSDFSYLHLAPVALAVDTSVYPLRGHGAFFAQFHWDTQNMQPNNKLRITKGRDSIVVDFPALMTVGGKTAAVEETFGWELIYHGGEPRYATVCQVNPKVPGDAALKAAVAALLDALSKDEALKADARAEALGLLNDAFGVPDAVAFGRWFDANFPSR